MAVTLLTRRKSRHRHGRRYNHYMPRLQKGLLFNLPLRYDARAIWSSGHGVLLAPSTETVDADGWYVSHRSGDLVAASANALRIGGSSGVTNGKGALLETAESNSIDSFSYRNYIGGEGSAFSATNMGVGGSIVCRDGTTRTSNQLTANAANATLIANLGVIASAAKVFSIWMRRATGTGNIDLTLDGGSTWTTVTLTTSWKRFEVTATLADPDVGIRIVTSGDVIDADFAQHEDGRSNMTSNIVGGATRATDVLEYDNTSEVNAVGTAGSLLFAVTPIAFSAHDSYVVLGNAITTDGVQIARNADGHLGLGVWSGGAQVADLHTGSDPVVGTTLVACATWQLDEFTLYADGSQVDQDTGGAAPATCANLIRLSGNDLGNEGDSHLAHVLVYDRVLAAEEVASVSRQIAGWVAN